MPEALAPSQTNRIRISRVKGDPGYTRNECKWSQLQPSEEPAALWFLNIKCSSLEQDKLVILGV